MTTNPLSTWWSAKLVLIWLKALSSDVFSCFKSGSNNLNLSVVPKILCSSKDGSSFKARSGQCSRICLLVSVLSLHILIPDFLKFSDSKKSSAEIKGTVSASTIIYSSKVLNSTPTHLLWNLVICSSAKFLSRTGPASTIYIFWSVSSANCFNDISLSLVNSPPLWTTWIGYLFPSSFQTLNCCRSISISSGFADSTIPLPDAIFLQLAKKFELNSCGLCLVFGLLTTSPVRTFFIVGYK